MGKATKELVKIAEEKGFKDETPVALRALSWIDQKVMTVVSRVLITAGFVYALVELVRNIHQLPEMVIGVIVTVISFYVITRAVRK